MRGAQLVEHSIERCGDFLGRGIRRQGRSVRGAGLGPDPLHGPSIVEVLANQARDLLDKRWSRARSIYLGEGATLEAQHAECHNHHHEDGMAQRSERSHGRTPRWLMFWNHIRTLGSLAAACLLALGYALSQRG